MKTNIQRGQLSTIILSSLVDGDKYGLEIIATIKEQSNGQLEIKQPTLYSTLTRIEKQGFITSYWRESDLGGKRHYYSITDLGKKQIEAQNGAFYTEFLTKSVKNLAITEHNQKYDEIEGLNFQNEGLVEQNNDIDKNSHVKIQNIDNELKNLGLSSTSFFENLSKDNIFMQSQFITNNNEIVENKKLAEENLELIKPENQEIIGKEEMEKEDEDGGVFLKPEEKIESNLNAKNEAHEKPVTECQGKFIEEKINPLNIPPVKKIEETLFSPKVSPPIVSKIKPPEIEHYQDKIVNLYEKSKKQPAQEQNVQIIGESIPNLKKYYGEKGINIFFKNGESDNVHKSHFSVSPHSLLYKYLTIFGLVTLETIICLISFFVIDGFIGEAVLFALFPLISTIPVMYYLLKSKGLSLIDFDKKSLLLSFLIFIVTLGIIYGLNIPLGVNLDNILEFKSTLIYPALISTNILVSSICDAIISKKSKL